MADASYIKHTDASAPDIRPQDGVAAVLRFCLVTNGNWTEPFTASGNIAVFKAPESVGGFYLHIDESNAGYAQIFGALDMSALSTVDNDRFPGGSTYVYFRNYASSTSDKPDWWCFYTDGFVHLWHDYFSSPGRLSGLMFGKPVLVNPSDTYGIMLSAEVASGAYSTANCIFTGNQGTWWCRDIAGNLGAAEGRKATVMFGNSGSTMGNKGPGNPFPGTLESYGFDRVQIQDDTTDDSARGWIPGMLAPCHNQPFTSGTEETVASTGKDYDGATFLPLQGYNSGRIILTADEYFWE